MRPFASVSRPRIPPKTFWWIPPPVSCSSQATPCSVKDGTPACWRATEIYEVKIRSVLTCRAPRAAVWRQVATASNLAICDTWGARRGRWHSSPPMSIGEAGHQAYMRTFPHRRRGGGDITQGLPALEELFEARKPQRIWHAGEIGAGLHEETTAQLMCNLTINCDDSGRWSPMPCPYSAGISEGGRRGAKGLALTRARCPPTRCCAFPGPVRLHTTTLIARSEGYSPQGVDHQRQAHRGLLQPDDRKGARWRRPALDLLSGSTVTLWTLWTPEMAVKARIDAGEKNEWARTGSSPPAPALLMGNHQGLSGHRVFLSATPPSKETPSAH